MMKTRRRFHRNIQSALAPKNLENLEPRQLFSTAAPAYLVPSAPGVDFTPIITTGDSVGGYTMAGTPDGLGAFDNGNGTFTLLMNHEFALASAFGGNEGVAHTHNASLGTDGAGSYIDRLVIRKSDLAVLSGGDQILKVFDGATGVQIPVGSHLLNFSRFCSADLAASTAFYNPKTGKGTTARLFLNGEETTAATDPVLAGVVGRAMAHIVTGPNNGNSYTLPLFGRHAWENLLANPDSGDTTLVIGNEDDTLTTSKVFIYVGTKQSGAGLNDIQKAGLTNGTLYNLKDNGDGTFAVVSDGSGSTFARPEDGAWDPNNPNDYYFVTTSNFTGNTQLFRLRFNDRKHPLAGGKIEVLVNGNDVGAKMFDNMAIDRNGNIILQEDVGGQDRLGKVWMYNIADGTTFEIAQHSPDLFDPNLLGTGLAGPDFLTRDEESSGVIDMSAILGEGKYLLDVQAHFHNSDPALVEGGQLLLLDTNVAKASLDGGVLKIDGTLNADKLDVSRQGRRITVTFDCRTLGVFDDRQVDQIKLNGFAGNDWLTIENDVHAPALMRGGLGNDFMKAGGANSIVIGDEGRDWLLGGPAQDILIGDTTTLGDAELGDALTTWSGPGSFFSRVNALKSVFTDAVIVDDGVIDFVFGLGGKDWTIA